MVEQVAAQEQVKVCPTCEKEIELNKFRLHEVMCARNHFKCPKCNKFVPKEEKD